MVRITRAGRTAAVLAALTTLFVPMTSQARAAGSFDVLQLNLCHSGLADCFVGGDTSVDSAIAAIKSKRPDVVTLNEVCASDITKLVHETGYGWTFAPVGNKGSSGPYQCSDGRGDYGVAILSHPDRGAVGDNVVRKQYAAQDGGNEQRVLLCAPYSDFAACTTHLSADNGDVAAKQCAELTGVAGGFGGSTVIGGDFNLTYGGSPNVQGCVPSGWFRKGDGSVQHVFATDARFDFERTENLPIDGTDHPGFLVELIG
jgi:hypothetical protein